MHPVEVCPLVAEDEGWRYSLDAQMDGLAPDRLFSLWPETLAPKVRTWVVDNLVAGEMRDIDVVLRDGPNSAPDVYFSFAYDLGDRFYVLERGAVKMSGPKADLDRDALLAGVSV